MKTLINTVTAFFCISLALFIVTGCNTESADDNNVIITPLSAEIAKGESITLTASGGFEYRWSLEDDEKGSWATLSNLEGPTTVYTSLRNSDSNGIPTVRVVKVSSFITGSGSSSNDTDATFSETHTAESYISHIVDPSTIGSVLKISPESKVIGPNETAAFTASGGDGNYTWTLSTTTYGSLTSASGDTTVYISNSSNVNTQVILTLSSGSENEAAIITHTP